MITQKELIYEKDYPPPIANQKVSFKRSLLVLSLLSIFSAPVLADWNKTSIDHSQDQYSSAIRGNEEAEHQGLDIKKPEDSSWDSLISDLLNDNTDKFQIAGMYLEQVTGAITGNQITLEFTEEDKQIFSQIFTNEPVLWGIRVDTTESADILVGGNSKESGNLINISFGDNIEDFVDAVAIQVESAGSVGVKNNQITLNAGNEGKHPFKGIYVGVTGGQNQQIDISQNQLSLQNSRLNNEDEDFAISFIEWSTGSDVASVAINSNRLLSSNVTSEKTGSWTGILGIGNATSQNIEQNELRFNKYSFDGEAGTSSLFGIQIQGEGTTNFLDNTISVSDIDLSQNLEISGISWEGTGESSQIVGNSVITSQINNKDSSFETTISGINSDSSPISGKLTVTDNRLIVSNSNNVEVTGISLLISGSEEKIISRNSVLIGEVEKTDLRVSENVVNDFTSGAVKLVGDTIAGVAVNAPQHLVTGKISLDKNLLNINNAYSEDELDILGVNVTALNPQQQEVTINGTEIILNDLNALSANVIANKGMAYGQTNVKDTNISLVDSKVASVVGTKMVVIGGSVSDQTISLTNSEAGVGVVGSVLVGATGSAEFSPQATKLVLTGHNTVGNVGALNHFVFNVSAENNSVDKALLTLTNSNSTELNEVAGADLYPSLTIDPYHFENALIEVTSDGSLDSGEEYFLIATTDESAKYTFNDLTIKSTETFAEITAVVDGSLTVDSNNPLTVTTPDKEDSGDTGDSGDSGESGDDPSTDEPDQKPDVDVVITATENSKTLSESLLGTVAFVNQGAEFIADEGLAAMLDSAKIGQVATFGAVHGGTSNYNTGSRVDVDGYTLATGMSYKVNPNWVIGGFIEAGWADSDSHVNGTKGEGDHDYYGIGFATRYSFDNNFYVDGSLRLGQASTEFTGLYAQDSAKYDSDAFYTTAHVGAGYVMPLTQNINLDMYGRYVLSYLDGDKVDLHNKYHDKLDMDSTVTHAVRVGGRLTGSFCSYADWKLGLAYEHVFDGDAESAVNSLNLEVPSLEGDTGVMELGVSMRPSQNSPWRLDIGAKGYAGDREGVTGNATVRYIF